MASTQKDILENILSELGTMKKKLPNGELKRMEQNFQEMKDFQHELKEDFSDIKYTLLNPEDGVIVKTNQNTQFRRRMEAGDKDFASKMIELEELKRWKEGVTRALWILFTGLAGVIVKLLLEAIKNG